VRILQLQTTMKSGGSSAIRLHRAFQKAGFESGILTCMMDKLVEPEIVYMPKKSRVIAWVDGKLKGYINRNNRREFGPFSYPVLGSDISRLKEIKNADIIYLHWVLGGFLNLSTIEKLLRLGKPVVMIMHDMWSITGGCHHSFTCDKYLSGCGNCPILPGNREKDLSFREFNKKQKLYSKYNNLFFVSPSRWLFDCTKKALLTRNKPVFCIPNALDGTIFKPFDKPAAKQILNIDPTETIIAFGAVAIESPYKGLTYMLEALQILHREGLEKTTVMIFGSNYNKQVADAIPFKTRFMGHLNDEYSMVLMYNSADVLVVPSLADNLPTVITEAMSCGTPVVGFHVGGIPDLIDHKKNGYVAQYKDAGDIARGILFCIENKIMGKRLPEFEEDQVVRQHVELMNLVKNKI
jgi:glycosyltransferase involved in cell wall biosynthesis